MKNLLTILNGLVLIGSVVIITVLSIELLSQNQVVDHQTVLKIQGVVCAIFLADFAARWWASKRKLRFLLRNFIFLLVSVPYMNIVDSAGIELSAGYAFLLRLMPLVRGGYGIAIVISYITRSKITNLFWTYCVTIIATSYFASLVFYSLEKGVNGSVNSFSDALWWAFMDVTTVGSNIYAVTGVGQILSVILAASGMMMFPIFTTYVLSYYQNKTKTDIVAGNKPAP